MGLDIITQKHCEIKEKVPQEQLLEQIKSRNRAFAVIDMVVQSGKSEDEALETEFTQTLQTLDGIKNEKVKVKKLLQNTAHLVSLSSGCRNCILSKNKDFGCIGYISYPISSLCEDWLASMAEEANKKGVPYSTTIVFIKEQNITGSRIKQMRAQGQTFFESSSQKKILLSKSLFKKDVINTDQLLEVTFLQGIMQTTHMNYLLMLYGGIVSSHEKPVDRPYKFNDESKKYVYLDLQLPENADKSIHEFYTYFHHLFLALINGYEVFTD
jgi:hypothetical protein